MNGSSEEANNMPAKSIVDYYLIEDEDSSDETTGLTTHRTASWDLTTKLKTVFLLVSLIVNLGFIINGSVRKPLIRSEISKYGTSNCYLSRTTLTRLPAGLQYDTPKPFYHSSPYSSENLTLAQEHWDAVNFDAGMIYISEDMVDSLGLPNAQPFPWDESKSIYLLNGYHNLHCLVSSKS